MGTVVYTLAGYHLSNLYVRAAVGEYTAMVFIPLAFYGLYSLLQGDKKGVVRLTLAATGLINAHILTTELIAAVLFIYMLANFRDTLAQIKSLLVTLAFILGINAFFLVPFIDSYTSQDLYINTKLTTTGIQSEGLYLRQILGLITTGSGSSYENSYTDEGYLNLGLLIIACALSMVLVIIKNKKWLKSEEERKSFKQVLTVFIVGVIAAFMSSIYFPWDAFRGTGILAKLFTSVQYPWRYLMIQTACFSLCGVYALRLIAIHITDRTGKKNMLEFKSTLRYDRVYVVMAMVIMLLAVGLTGIFDYELACKNVTVANATAGEDWADKLYLPAGTDRDYLKSHPYEGKLAYSHLHVYDEEGQEVECDVNDNNVLVLPDSTSHYTYKFVVPLSWHVAEAISVATMVVAGVFLYKRRGRKYA